MAGELPTKRLHIADYLIFAATVLVSLGIGFYHALSRSRVKTTGEYFLGGRGLRTVPVALSILVSFVSAITVLGIPAEMYTQGTQMTVRTLGYCLAIFLSSMLFVPLLYSLRITSSFEYLERRYGSTAVRLMGSFIMILGNLLYIGLVIYTPSTALEAVTGIPFWVSVMASAFVATVYTAIGGMRAVVWTDAFQAIVMFAGMLAIVVQGTIKVGGMARVWELSGQGGRLIWLDFTPDPTVRLSFWSLVIGGLFSGVGIFGIGQSSMQRYCALPTLTQAKMSLYLAIPGLIIVNVLASLVGLVIYAYYAQAGCDPLGQKYISNQNQLVPYFVIDVLNYPGFPGIFLAVLFSGALSSVSSVLNSLTAVTWQDILSRCCANLTVGHKAIINTITVVVYGILSIGIAFLTNGLGINVLQASLTFSGVTMGPSLGLFLVGAIFPFVTTAGALIGCGSSLALSLWIVGGNFVHRPSKYTRLPTFNYSCTTNHTVLFEPVTFTPGYPTHNWTMYQALLQSPGQTSTLYTSFVEDFTPLSGLYKLYSISFLWYTALGACITIIIGVIMSLIMWKLTASGEENVDPQLVFPLAEHLCCILPARWRYKLSCGSHITMADFGEYKLTAQKDGKLPDEVSVEIKTVKAESSSDMEQDTHGAEHMC